VERPVDFASLFHHGCDFVEYYEAQDLGHYFSMLNGPTYESLVKHFWVRASVTPRYPQQLINNNASEYITKRACHTSFSKFLK